jgi:hypothetical protein
MRSPAAAVVLSLWEPCSHVPAALCIAGMDRFDMLPQLVQAAGAPALVAMPFLILLPALLPVVIQGGCVTVRIAPVAVTAPTISTAPALCPILLR